jgi:hypothetical protein
MYATGVGLVIKGFQDLEKKAKEPLKPAEENNKEKKKKDKVVQAKEHRPSFFESLADIFKDEKDTPL